MAGELKHLFNAHHAPIGAFASFTLGESGRKGGFGLELGQPADHDVYIGLQDSDDVFRFLPFCRPVDADDDDIKMAAERARYEVGRELSTDLSAPRARLSTICDCEMARDFKVSSDTWKSGDLTFRILSPVAPVPDPSLGDTDELKRRLVPAVLATLTVDNRASTSPRKAVFGFAGSGGHDISALRRLDDVAAGRLTGVGLGRTIALATRDEGVVSAQSFTIGDILSEQMPENLAFGLGAAAALIATVPAGELRSFRFAVCFYRGGLATAGLDSSYYYTRFWDSIEAVADYALANFDLLESDATEADSWIENAPVSRDQRFMLTHAIRSYHGSTQLLQDAAGLPLWIVNEGEYRMMNTLDLTADQLFYEMAMNPWTVKNELDLFADRYSYADAVRFPGDETLHEGGVSFTHDMGVANVFSRPHYSSYEKYGLRVCFSHMTHEELVNWLCCALTYGRRDADWLRSKMPLIELCMDSMARRDHPDPSKRDGIMSLDSSRCMGGAEITTYDSLDASLGQARGNVYLAGKCWAAYLGLARVFEDADSAKSAAEAKLQAERCAATICASESPDSTIPAVIGENVPARIIPAIEGLVFLEFFGCDTEIVRAQFADYFDLLRRHLRAVLREGVCLFPGGAWKLSSTSDNSWLSKIYLCQYVARHILGVDGAAVTADADAAHVSWLLDPRNTYWAWSDQIVAGLAQGSKYYPRGVTAWLWLKEKGYRPAP
jgi:hypothetical protein